MRKSTSFGGLVRAETKNQLQLRDCRPERPALPSVASISAPHLVFGLVFGWALVVAICALAAAQASGAPGPDPYRPSPTTAQAPTPDPDPLAKTSAPLAKTSTPTPVPNPAPEPAPVTSTPRSSSSETVGQQPTRTTPQKHALKSRASQVKGLKEGTASPRAAPKKKTKPIAAHAIAAVVASTSRLPLALAGLALLALAAASGSLLYLLPRVDASRAEV